MEESISAAGACLFLTFVTVSTNAAWREDPLLQGATADTTAELGCNCLQFVSNRVCHLIRPVRIGGNAVPAGPGSRLRETRMAGACHTPWTVYCRTVPTAFSMIDKLDGFGCSCCTVVGKAAVITDLCKKTRKARRPQTGIDFSIACLEISWLFYFRLCCNC